MLYYNARYKFALPGTSPTNIGGTILAASSMPAGQLHRREFKEYPHLQHRLFDPQLYLAGLDPQAAEGSVFNLATWPWFGQEQAPAYRSDRYGSIKKWKDKHKPDLLKGWTGQVPSDPDGVEIAVRAAIKHQLRLGCEGIILPSPLTTVVARDFECETDWIDTGLAMCEELGVSLPVYATVAISDNVLRGVNPFEHPLLHTITSNISARSSLTGAYIVLEQSNEDGYVCRTRETVTALFLLVDDVARGAAKRVIVNYGGALGVITEAIGAAIWCSGYYMSQRRLRLSDYEDKIARAMPRYFSLRLAGDIGLEKDLSHAFRAGLGDRIFTDTKASAKLKVALLKGTYPATVPEWKFRISNITAAAGHYYEVANKMGTQMSTTDPGRRLDLVSRWLERAVGLAEDLKKEGIAGSHYTELKHQHVWSECFEDWRGHAGV